MFNITFKYWFKIDLNSSSDVFFAASCYYNISFEAMLSNIEIIMSHVYDIFFG
jgi:hypothetical protein